MCTCQKWACVWRTEAIHVKQEKPRFAHPSILINLCHYSASALRVQFVLGREQHTSAQHVSISRVRFVIGWKIANTKAKGIDSTWDIWLKFSLWRQPEVNGIVINGEWGSHLFSFEITSVKVDWLPLLISNEKGRYHYSPSTTAPFTSACACVDKNVDCLRADPKYILCTLLYI